MNERTDGRTDGQADGRTDGRTHESSRHTIVLDTKQQLIWLTRKLYENKIRQRPTEQDIACETEKEGLSEFSPTLRIRIQYFIFTFASCDV